MRLHFLGAAGEVTGSATLLEVASARVLVDFGMHQGSDLAERRNRRMPPLLDPARLDAVVLTHAHIDHIGRLPLLPRAGFRGPIWCTRPTAALAAILLRDAAKIQEEDAAKLLRRRRRTGRDHVTPLYTTADAERVLPLLRTVEYGTTTEVADGVRVRMVDAGHILGSASLELSVAGPTPRTIVFSGDLGPKGMPLVRDPTPLHQADLVVLESTYGDRDHRPFDQTLVEFESIIRDAVWNKEKVLIPSFAVGRAQQLVYQLGILSRSNRVPVFPVYLDSPMAIEALALHRRYLDFLDADTRKAAASGLQPLCPDNLTLTPTSEESRRLNSLEGAAVIIAGSGMCTGGRILHHLRHNLWRRGVHVMIVGFQPAGTRGRQLVDKAPFIRIWGDPIAVRAQIHTLGGFSAHAGQSALLEWAAHFRDAGPRFVLNHGEDRPRAALGALLSERLGVTVDTPAHHQTIDL
jgi:metallo-beta-lactamase family protein